MTNSTNSTSTPAAQEIDPAKLDEIAGGAGIVVHQARKQEESDKLVTEEAKK